MSEKRRPDLRFFAHLGGKRPYKVELYHARQFDQRIRWMSKAARYRVRTNGKWLDRTRTDDDGTTRRERVFMTLSQFFELFRRSVVSSVKKRERKRTVEQRRRTHGNDNQDSVDRPHV